jgi:hypothetical protein
MSQSVTPTSDARPGRRAPLAQVVRVECRTEGSAGRDEFEDYVARIYHCAYGARVTHFLPLLVGLRDADGGLAGVIGARPAREAGPLFLESYLDEPIEQALAGRLGVAVPRWALVEVGNLASHRPGAGRLLVGTLANLLDGLGTPLAVFTATQPLRTTFERMGVTPVQVARADGARLGPALAEWGRYYETDPRVCAVPVAFVRDAARRDAALSLEMGPLWRSAQRTGRRLGAEAA